jgi:hypothetical protein
MNINLENYTKEELIKLEKEITLEIERRIKEEKDKYIKEIIKQLKELYKIDPIKEFLFNGYYDYENIIHIFEEEL